MARSLTVVVHGESGVGKSWFADTAPGPRLVLDAEGGNKFTPSKKTTWDASKDDPPEADGSWDTCLVTIPNFQVLGQVYQWLNSGKHPFKSVVLDSLTEIQKKCMDSIAGTNQPTQQDWGALLRQMESLVRLFRDLTMHPKKPLESVVIVAMTSVKDDKYRAHVQGQLGVTLPYFVDVVGYMYTKADPETNEQTRHMLVQPTDRFDAKDRTDRLGTVIDNPNVEHMLDTVFSDKE